MSILFVVPLTDSYYKSSRDAVLSSVRNILDMQDVDVKVLIVFQTVNNQLCDVDFAEDDRVEVIVSRYFGVSRSRNAGIDYAIGKNIEYIVFHDSSVYITKPLIEFYEFCVKKDVPVAKGFIRWTCNIFDESGRGSEIGLRKVKPLYDSCLGSYLFSVREIGGLRFNEQMGPGADTIIKAGEDVVFILRFFSRIKNRVVLTGGESYVNHLPRPADRSKHLLYSEAQGVLLRRLLRKDFFDKDVLVYFFLFWGRAVFDFLMMRPNSWLILKRRIRGFVDSDGNRFVI